MHTKPFFSLLLLGLTVLYSISMRSAAQSAPDNMQQTPLPVHLLDAQRINGILPVGIPRPGTLWVSPHQAIDYMLDGSIGIGIVDTESGQKTPLNLVNSIGAHQEEYYDPSAIRISPDGQWLLWSSGSKAKPTWIAVSLDGRERREWPRTTLLGGENVAWMQDSQHWVELSSSGPEIGISGPAFLNARVYDTETSQIKEFPLVSDDSNPATVCEALFSNGKFIFTQDGRAWTAAVTERLWTGNDSDDKSNEDLFVNSLQDSFELLPGPLVWTIHKWSSDLGALANAGTFDDCQRSPDDNWLVQRNCTKNGKGPMHIVLTRIDGTEPQIIYTGNIGNLQWTADSQHIAFLQNGALCRITLTDLETKAELHKPRSKMQIAGLFKKFGKFPTASPRTLLAKKR